MSELKTWPGAFGIYKQSKEAVMLNIYPLVGLIALYIIASVIIGAILSSFGMGSESLLGNLADLLLGSAATVSFTVLILASIRGKKMELGPALQSCISTLTLKVLVLTVLMGIIAFASILLLIIPFFIIVPRISLAPYFLIDKDMDILDSISASWNATKGSLGKVWGVIGVSILFGIAILVLVGIYLSIMYAAVFGLLYTFLTKQSVAKSNAAAGSPLAS